MFHFVQVEKNRRILPALPGTVGLYSCAAATSDYSSHHTNTPGAVQHGAIIGGVETDEQIL